MNPESSLIFDVSTKRNSLHILILDQLHCADSRRPFPTQWLSLGSSALGHVLKYLSPQFCAALEFLFVLFRRIDSACIQALVELWGSCQCRYPIHCLDSALVELEDRERMEEFQQRLTGLLA